MGDRDGIAKVHDTLGVIAYNRGDYADARGSYLKALAIHRDLGGSYEEGNTLAMLAEVYTALGQADEARALARQAEVIAERIAVPQLLSETLYAMAEAEMAAALASPHAAGMLADAAARAARAAELAEQIGSRLDYGLARRLAGQIAGRLGVPADADFLAAEAVFCEIRSSFELACTWARYGEYLSARNPEAADTYLRRAAETFQRIDACGELRRIELQRAINHKKEP
jgi:tetratricopeptide (TPR) repeat protein